MIPLEAIERAASTATWMVVAIQKGESPNAVMATVKRDWAERIEAQAWDSDFKIKVVMAHERTLSGVLRMLEALHELPFQ